MGNGRYEKKPWNGGGSSSLHGERQARGQRQKILIMKSERKSQESFGRGIISIFEKGGELTPRTSGGRRSRQANEGGIWDRVRERSTHEFQEIVHVGDPPRELSHSFPRNHVCNEVIIIQKKGTWTEPNFRRGALLMLPQWGLFLGSLGRHFRKDPRPSSVLETLDRPLIRGKNEHLYWSLAKTIIV